MPNMNGFELVRKIWAIDPNADIVFCLHLRYTKKKQEKYFQTTKTIVLLQSQLRQANL
jgi:hypothetical protein